jgi:hypothetical protein
MTAVEPDRLAFAGPCFKSDGVCAFFHGGCFDALQEARTDSAAARLGENDHPFQLGGAIGQDHKRDGSRLVRP